MGVKRFNFRASLAHTALMVPSKQRYTTHGVVAFRLSLPANGVSQVPGRVWLNSSKATIARSIIQNGCITRTIAIPSEVYSRATIYTAKRLSTYPSMIQELGIIYGFAVNSIVREFNTTMLQCGY
uniref:Uncharacterized protein n=1 Tax=Vespula pensylvanica TaxID=30213 RepID=A0A834UG52_VESPE|nr:hypothetical protein H0235_000123 [Vespula pensylvanica]